MVGIAINKELAKNNLKRFWDFALSISDEISLTSYYRNYRDEQIDDANKELLEYTEKSISKRIGMEQFEAYKKQSEWFCRTTTIHNNSFRNNAEDILTLEEQRVFNASIYQEVTNISHCTVGEIRREVFFKTDNSEIKRLLYNFQGLFDSEVFDDPGFYKNNRCIISICSHEGYCLLDLTDTEYEAFEKINIPESGIEIYKNAGNLILQDTKKYLNGMK